jgi:vancomycin resistance protein YoaR
VILGLYVLAIVMVGSDVPRGTRVAGVDVGNMSAAAATAKLTSAVPGAMPQKLTLTAADRTFDLVPADSGLSVDVAATVAKAKENSKSPGVALRALFGQTRSVDPVVTTDVGRLTAALEEIGGMVKQEKVEGGLAFLDGVVTSVDPVPGRTLDVAGTVPAVEEAWRERKDEATAVIAADNPSVTPEAVAKAMTDWGTKAMAAPVTVRVGETAVEVTPGQLGKYLTSEPDNGGLRPVVDGEGLAAMLMETAPDLGVTARDAKFTFKDGKPQIVPSRAGTTIDPAKLGDAVAAVVTAEGPREVTAEVTTSEPKFTTADAEALGIKEKLSSFKTSYPYAAYRVTNIGRAAKLINGSLVKPGETWSLNKRVGQRTAANGFVKGFIIKGEKFQEDLGGGVSQSATTTFNAVFFAGLKDIEHHPHSLYIARYPAGREATVAWPYKDLRFQNDSGHGVLIQARADVGWIEVTFWGTKVWDKIESYSSPRRNIRPWKTIVSTEDKCIPQLPAEGFDITVTRAFIQNGEEVRREAFNTSYQATDKIVCAKENPDATATPVPTSTETPSATPVGTSAPTPEPEEESGEQLLGPPGQNEVEGAIPRTPGPMQVAGRRRRTPRL